MTTPPLRIPRHQTRNKRNYYAHLLDNIGPLPKEVTQVLPDEIFDAIWQEFYHYLTLVSETAMGQTP